MPTSIPDKNSLEKLKVFADFKPSDVELLIGVSDEETYKKGDLIVKEGEQGDSMYVIMKGSARVYHSADSVEVKLADITVGDFFGELALVDTYPRSASVVAEEDCTVLRIAQTNVGVLAGVSTRTAIKLLVAIGRSLAARVRAGNKKYSDLILLGHRAAE